MPAFLQSLNSVSTKATKADKSPVKGLSGVLYLPQSKFLIAMILV
jgi:hypothetical protein